MEMEPEDRGQRPEEEPPAAGPHPKGAHGLQDSSLTDILRIKEQMSNQCFEMMVQLSAVKIKTSCNASELKRDLADDGSDLEDAKTAHFNKTIALHRMQMWHAIAEKLKQNDSGSDDIKAESDRCMALCSQITQLQQESRDLKDQITDTQKKRLELKRLTHEKMKEIEELLNQQEHPDIEKYKAALQKGRSNLEKYKKMAVITQNVLRGILIACKVNWLDDPKLKSIAMTLEDLPISD